MKTSPLQAKKYELISLLSKEVEVMQHAKQRRWANIDSGGYFQWVKDNWTARGTPLDFEEHTYLIDLYKDQSAFIAMMKSAQTGGTERAVTEALWLPDQFNENSLYVFPTGGSVSDLVQERIDEPLNNKAYLRQVSGRVRKAFGKHADKVGLKRMSKGFIYFRGSGSPAQITSVPADAIFVDEVDRMPIQSIPYIPKRLEHSNRRWQRWLSTPTIPNYGIHKIFLTTDMRYYNIRCNDCNEWQVLDFWKNVEYTLRNEVHVENARLVCAKCRKDIVPWKCEGKWVPTAESDKHGYHLSKLYSPRMNLKELIEASLKTSEWEVQQFYNQDLGLPYEPKGGRITEEILHSCVRDYVLPVKDGGDNFMGIDVGTWLHVIIQNSAGQIVLIARFKTFDELDDVMEEFNIKHAVIDAMPETRKAQEFVNKYNGRASMCYYSMKTVEDEKWFKVDTEDPFVVHTNRTISLDMYSNKFNKQKIELPKDIDNYEEFKDHMKALTRAIVDKSSGTTKASVPVAEYLQTGPDHYYHAGNYSNIAKAIFDEFVEPDVFFV